MLFVVPGVFLTAWSCPIQRKTKHYHVPNTQQNTCYDVKSVLVVHLMTDSTVLKLTSNSRYRNQIPTSFYFPNIFIWHRVIDLKVLILLCTNSNKTASLFLCFFNHHITSSSHLLQLEPENRGRVCIFCIYIVASDSLHDPLVIGSA